MPGIHRLICAAAGLLLCLPLTLAAAPNGDNFDHFTTGFPLAGGHRAVECDACHTAGQFRGTPRECASCHNLLTNTGAVVKNSAHIQTSNDCALCHSTLSWDDVRRVNHMAVLGDCNSCHYTGSNSGGPPGDTSHSANSMDCISCHRTSTWLSVHFRHTGGTCTNCHSPPPTTGGFAARPAPNTPAHSNGGFTCEECHTTHNWLFSHSTVIRPCSGCHLVVGNLNGIRSRPTGDIHDLIPATTECNACHSTRVWIPAEYFHTVTYYTTKMTRHRRAACQDCHSSGYTSAGTYASPGGYAQSCSGCHADKYELSKHDNVSLSTNRDCASSGCHGYSDW